MQCKVVYTRELLKDYQTYLFTKGCRNLRKIEGVVLILLFLYNLFFAHRNILFPLLYLFAVIVFMEVLLRFYTWYKFMNEQKDLLNHEVTYHFQKEQVYIKSKTIDSLIRYAELKKVVETNKSLFLYEAGEDAFLVSKDCLKKDDVEELLKQLKDKRVVYQHKTFRYI